MSILGRILITSSYGISQFIYLVNLLPFPAFKMKEINEIMYEYIWNGKTSKVKRNNLIQDYALGGLKMPDVLQVTD